MLLLSKRQTTLGFDVDWKFWKELHFNAGNSIFSYTDSVKIPNMHEPNFDIAKWRYGFIFHTALTIILQSLIVAAQPYGGKSCLLWGWPINFVFEWQP